MGERLIYNGTRGILITLNYIITSFIIRYTIKENLFQLKQDTTWCNKFLSALRVDDWVGEVVDVVDYI